MSRFTRLVTQMMATHATTRTAIDKINPTGFELPDVGFIALDAAVT
jgi:hypothetical protein